MNPKTYNKPVINWPGTFLDVNTIAIKAFGEQPWMNLVKLAGAQQEAVVPIPNDITCRVSFALGLYLGAFYAQKMQEPAQPKLVDLEVQSGCLPTATH